MNEREQYELYAAWCERLGIRPATFDKWRNITEHGVSAYWGAIRNMNLGRRASA